MLLFVLFIAIPLIEIALFVQIGGAIGLWPTLAVVIVTALLGSWLLRQQGRAALAQLQQSFGQLSDPSEPLAHGAMILFAGALLLTPGFFTDAVGFSLMIPQVRAAAYRALRARVNVVSFQTGPMQSARDASVIDGDFEEVDEHTPRQSGPSGWTQD